MAFIQWVMEGKGERERNREGLGQREHRLEVEGKVRLP